MSNNFDREDSFSIEFAIGKDDAVQQTISIKDSLYAFSTKKIFRIHTADDIDPDRTALDTRHSHQEVYTIGCSNSFVARTIIQAKKGSVPFLDFHPLRCSRAAQEISGWLP